jgi:hypothetical protein
MDLKFMEQFYEGMYEDPEEEFGKNNSSSYTNVVHRAYVAIDKAEKIASSYDKKMVKALQTAFDAVAEQTKFSVKLAYLRGAEDRERMLR